SMSNQLLFEARRGRVWLAKAMAVVLTGVLIAALVWAAYWTGLWAVAETRGITTPSDTVTDLVAAGARFTALGGAVALGGYALTMLFRSTVGTVGFVFATTVASYVLLLSLPGTGTQRWLLHQNVFAFVNGSWEYYDPTLCRGAMECDGMTTLTACPAAAYLAVLLALPVIASVLSFRRRDVP
ncbi:hypothetical protein, partial [Nocardioides sp.]|uniref:hypothetical protein n=1 Tax=Nocardioides sp. TaxID=35761 RepID=UPI002735FE91